MESNRTPSHPRFAPPLLLTAALAAGVLTSAPALAAPPYTLFEAGQVRPLALSHDGKLLFATNTPDNRLEVFRVAHDGLTHRASIPVGLEPVAVAVRSDSEVWVVNHLSDSVSVVRLDDDGRSGRVVRTLLVGDEPRDIVFAGPQRGRAFITTAHRGQNSPIDPQLTTPGVGRADVWVFDAGHLGSSLGGDPLTIVTLFSDTPRSLAVTPDGSRVYAAGFHSGNRTTTITQEGLPLGQFGPGFGAGFGPGGVPGPSTNFEGITAPDVSLIVQHNGTHWVSSTGDIFDFAVPFNLPDKDVFVIDAMASHPAQVAGTAGFFTGVGTVLFNMVVNPVSGKVYVSNTDANNLEHFEGPGTFAGHSLRGHLHESRITVLGSSGVTPRHLNKHIDYGTCCSPVPNDENARSLASPQGMAITHDGKTLYVAAMGSDKIGIYKTAELENDTFVPSVANQVHVTGGGPTNLVLDADEDRIFALTRFDNAISIIDTKTRAEVGHVPMYNPEPASVTHGRRFLYDASFSSSHGDSSCASCHVSGDFDSLAWDLGNPDAKVASMPGPFAAPPTNFFTFPPTPIPDPKFHPMKGPMTTQSLRGMANHGPMHWRGDRTGGLDDAGNILPSAQPDTGIFDERAAFKKFQRGFTDLLGRSEFIPDSDMEAFADFILQVTYPPNPIRALDNSLTADQQAGRDLFFTRAADNTRECNGCHRLDHDGNRSFGVDAPGFFGTLGEASFDFQPQLLKTPHLRNAYQKVGRFGFGAVPFFVVVPGDNGFMGDQMRGIGFLHDGSFDTLFRFLQGRGFGTLLGFPQGFPDHGTDPLTGRDSDELRRQIEQFILAFDSNMAPIVGQQITLSGTNGAVAGSRIDLLEARANVGECDLVAKSQDDGQPRGFLYIGAGSFMPDRQAHPIVSDAALRAFAAEPGHEVTYTCTPPGSGERIGIDHDLDGILDGDALDDEEGDSGSGD